MSRGQPILTPHHHVPPPLRYPLDTLRLPYPHPTPGPTSFATTVPGEELKGDVQKLKVVPAGEALRLKAIRDFTSEELGETYAGDEWLFEGPGTYYPRVDVQELQTVCAKVIMPNQALRLRARKACTDRKGTARSAGEEWLMRETGAYMPGIDEETVGIIQVETLTKSNLPRLDGRRLPNKEPLLLTWASRRLE